MDPVLKDFIFSKPDIVAVEYHTNFPYLGDVFYTPNPAENNARIQYYPINFVPSVRFDGSTNGTFTSSEWQGHYDTRKAVPSRARIELSGSWDPGAAKTSGALQVRVIAETTLAGGDWRLRAAITESDIFYMAGNGINEHHHVMRKMLPDAGGTALSFAGPYPDTADVPLAFTIDPSWDPSEVAFAVFLQDDNTTEVEQSAQMPLNEITVDVPVGDTPPRAFAIDSIRPNPFNPSAVISWHRESARPLD
ncbi:MAG: Omp28-related outer membrane protein, partial [Gemmatimonadetes bacterium]|nr:Omp28-related outer membrane protein [Gemmatimonadota bacterium]